MVSMMGLFDLNFIARAVSDRLAVDVGSDPRSVGRGLHQKLGDWFLSSREPMALVLNVPTFGSH